MMCEACQRGDHANCAMQTWCDCEDTRDGDHTASPDYDPTLWCNGCGARTPAECDCGDIADTVIQKILASCEYPYYTNPMVEMSLTGRAR